MKRPFLPLALLYAAGIVAGNLAPLPLGWLFGLCFALCLTALGWQAARPWLLVPLLFLAGWTNEVRQTAVVSPNDLRAILTNQAADVQLRGTIRQTPTERIYERGAKEFWRTATQLDVQQVGRDGVWQPAAGEVLVGTPGVLDSNFCFGQSVEVRGILRPMRGPLAEGLFNPKEFYGHEGIYRKLLTETSNDWTLLSPPGKLALSERFSTWARQTLARGLPDEDEPLRLMWTLALDWKAPLTQTVEEPFMQAGTFHIFAVDGLRVGLLAAIGVGLLRALQIPRAACGLVVIPLIWGYVGLTGWPASAVRAGIMTSIIVMGWAAKRPSDMIASLFAAAFLILLWDPRQLFQAGFQLSFTVVFCIGVLLPPLRKLLHERWFPPDPLLPDELRPAWRVALDRLRRWALDLLAISFAAWLGSIPLAAWYFHLFTPVSVTANFIVVPLTALALMSCIGSLLTGAWFPWLSILFNFSGWFWMKCIIAISQWSVRWPASHWFVAAPRPSLMILYYLALLILCTGWVFRTKHKLPAAAVLLAAAIFCGADWAHQRGASRLDVLALTGAPAVFVSGDHTQPPFLADCGESAAAEAVTLPFLHAHGVNHLENFCLTAGYPLLAGGAENILTNFSVPEVWSGPGRVRSPAFRRLEADLAQTPGRWRTAQAGDAVAGWTALYPSTNDHFGAADDLALAWSKTIRGHSVLLLSVLGRNGQDMLAQRHPELRAEIVIAGLPMRDEPLSEPLLDLLQPKLIIVADAEFPATRRAGTRLRERLVARPGTKVIFCRDSGSLTLLLRDDAWELQDAEGRPASFASASPTNIESDTAK